MVDFCINPLSADEQCFSVDDVTRIVSNAVGCLNYLLPAIKKGRVRLVYDVAMEERRLVANEHFLSSINRIPKTLELRDVTVLWFTYTRNRAEPASLVGRIDVSITSPEAAGEESNGEIDEAWASGEGRWLSLGGTTLNEASRLHLSVAEDKRSQVRNAHHLESVRLLMPRYEPSPKHRPEPYVEDGVKVSAMPLTDNDAQQLLLISLKDGDKRWAYCDSRGKCYRFNFTNVETDVYHGFEVEDDEVPADIRPQL